MEPMITISVKDYNKLVRSSGEKRVAEILEVVVDNVVKGLDSVRFGGSFNVVNTLQSFIKQLQSEEFSFEKVLECYKNNKRLKSPEGNKEGNASV